MPYESVGKCEFSRPEESPARICSMTMLFLTLSAGKKGAIFCVTRAAEEG